MTAARLGLGLAALGRPGYLTLGHAADLAGKTSVDALERHCHAMLDAAWAAGIRWFDCARSYGRAEAFVATWLAARGIAPADVTISSKWGYRYVAAWQTTAPQHEIKEHTRATLDTQLAESRALLGDHLALYQVHSLTLDSPLWTDRDALARLAAMRDGGLPIGLSLSGPQQRETLERALAVEVGGAPLWSAVQATWNLLERAVEPALVAAAAAGWRVLIKEAVANGRLAGHAAPDRVRAAADAHGVTPDAIALAAALAQPFARVVLSGAATQAQLSENLRARDLDGTPIAAELADLAVEPHAYWAARAQLAWS